MAIVVTCECGRRLQIQDQYAGQEGQCPGCGSSFPIPDPYAESPEEHVPVLPLQPVESPDPTPRQVRNDVPPPPEPEGPIPDHGGEPVGNDVDFFAQAPAEIGPVLSAYSTLRHGVEPWTAGGRAALSGGLAVVGGLLAFFIVAAIDPRNDIWYAVWPLGAATIGFLIGLGSTGFTHVCSFVGRDGAARCTCTGDRTNISSVEVFCFRDATELRTGQTRRYVNGAYQGTNYSFTWTDVGGRTRYTFSGTHHAEKTAPPSTDAFQYGRAAELAWTVYLVASAFRQLELNGSVPFHLAGSKMVRIGEGFVVVCDGGQEDRWEAKDIEGVLVDQGVVRIKRFGAKEGWFSTQGVFKFDFANLANAQLFLYLVEKVAGLQVN